MPAPRRRPTLAVCAAAALVAPGGCVGADERHREAPVLDVAVAASLAGAHAELARRFEATSGVRLRTSVGATGQLYAQIVAGAPYDVLLAADEDRPRRLAEEGLAVAGTRFTYALGRLALYAPGAAPLPDPPWGLLTRPDVRVAIANPKTAPYGAAALEVMEALRLEIHPTSDLVVGESVAHAYQYVRSRAAEAGFVALAQVRSEDPSGWLAVPERLHRPLRQDAVLLAGAAADTAARAYVAFLRGPEAAEILLRHGFGVPGRSADAG